MDFSVQSAFDFALYGLVDSGNDWDNVNNITKLSNTYPFSHIPISNITIEEMNFCLEKISTVKAGHKAIAFTGATHDMDQNYGFFLSYHQSYSRGHIWELPVLRYH